MARKKPRRLTQEEKEELIRRSRQGGNNPAGGRPVETDPDRLFANRRKDKKDEGDEGRQLPLDMSKGDIVPFESKKDREIREAK